MGKITGFLEIDREDRHYEPAADRIRHYREFIIPPGEAEVVRQAARCMDCGIPYCHTGCPVNNQIPDWNDLVYHADWRDAPENLHSTNNFPEVTGRICPAPCEAACTLNIIDEPVTIKTIECAIADKAFDEGWVRPVPPRPRPASASPSSGSGPAGLAAAQQLARAGHDVHVYEKNAQPGGLLRYGIPDFKMEKYIVERRVEQMEAEGVTFHLQCRCRQGRQRPKLERDYDAVLLTGGAEHPRDLTVPGRELAGIHFAMNYLPQQNRRVSGEPLGDVEPILATGKQVVVIGGGDTGSDCIGTAFRQGAVSVTQLEIMPMPPEKENKALTWPNWPLKLRTSSSQAEGAARDFSVATSRFLGTNGRVEQLECIRLDSQIEARARQRVPDPCRPRAARHGLPASGAERHGEGSEARPRCPRQCEGERARLPHLEAKVFAAGDMRRGQSLVVWAIREGPPGRARHRQIPDGQDRFAALSAITGLRTGRRTQRRY